MSDIGRHKINCWVPESLWEKVESLGYDSPTKATIAGYEALIEKGNLQDDGKTMENNWERPGNKLGNLGNDWEFLGKQLEEAQLQIKGLEDKLSKSPDPLALAQLRVKSEELEKRNENERTYLKKEIGRLTIALQESPDPVELVKLQTENEGLKMVLEERNKRIEEISNHYENISSFANHFKSKEPLLIEAPAVEKKKPWYKRIFSS